MKNLELETDRGRRGVNPVDERGERRWLGALTAYAGLADKVESAQKRAAYFETLKPYAPKVNQGGQS